MGQLFSGNTGRTDDPDPVTGLTSRDRYLVTSTWANIRKNYMENGIKLLIILFEKHPQYQSLFPFADVPMKDLPENHRFQAHCTRIMYAFSSVVDSLGNVDLFMELLEKLGKDHVKRNVPKEAFLEFKDVIIELFSSFMTKTQVDAWKLVMNFVFAQITIPYE